VVRTSTRPTATTQVTPKLSGSCSTQLLELFFQVHDPTTLDRQANDVGTGVSLDTPMLWSVGFLTTFLFGGLTGIIQASPPLDFHVTDSYFVVAHIHYVVFGTAVFAMFAGFYFCWPKMTGRMLDERLGKLPAAAPQLPQTPADPFRVTRL
jgi:heme/copper-type cytochrome/quinol oxidase subunit 1